MGDGFGGNRLLGASEKPYLIGIAGPSCAGKTELTRLLALSLSAAVLPLDCYYIDLSHLPLAQRAQHNFDHPDSLDDRLFRTHLKALAKGESIERPVYDFATHSRSTTTQQIRPGRFMLVEGLFVLFWDELRELLNTKVFVDLDDEQCLKRRVVRDVRERGRTPESVIAQFNRTVRPMAESYIRPTHGFADVVVRGDDPIEASVAAVMAHVDLNADRKPVAGFLR